MATSETWNEHWRTKDTPWDLGGTTPALIEWAKQQPAKGLKVLVPGCGAGHDAHYLAKQGARVTAVDFVQAALDAAAERYPGSSVDWVRHDVLTMPFDGAFDRVWEHTCFCALDPDQRSKYFESLARALKPGGVYWGLVFLEVAEPENGPPFQVEAREFRRLLDPHFEVSAFEPGTDRSIAARKGRELWFSAAKRI